MRTFIKITVLAVLCGVVIFFPNNFVNAATQLKKEPVYYATIKPAAEKDIAPKIFAAIKKDAENYVGSSTSLKPTLRRYKDINYILSYDYGVKIQIYPSLSANTSMINDGLVLLNKNGIYLSINHPFDGIISLIHIDGSTKTGFRILAKDGSFLIFKDAKRVYEFMNAGVPNVFSLTGLSGQLKAHKEDPSYTPDYYTDKKHVYYVNQDRGLKILEGADPKTFQKINEKAVYPTLYKDKRNVYYRGLEDSFKKIEKADPDTLKIADVLLTIESSRAYLTNYVLIDKEHVFTYSQSKHIFEMISDFNLNDVDPMVINAFEFQLLDFSTAGVYQELLTGAFLDKKHGKVYTVDSHTGKTVEIQGADPLTFGVRIILDSNYKNPPYIYFQDKSSVYVATNSYLLAKAPDADIETFELVCNKTSPNLYLYKDKNHVYYSRENDVGTLANADPSSFNVLDEILCSYAADKNHVFSLKEGEYTVRDDLDAATFNYVAFSSYDYYTYDKNGVYFNENLVDGLDPANLNAQTGIDGYTFFYLYDDNDIWFFTGIGSELKKVEGADPKTFDFTKSPPDFTEGPLFYQ